MQQEQHCLLYFWLSIETQPFSRTTKPRRVPALFHSLWKHRMLPSSCVPFSGSDKWAFDWIHQQRGIWVKDGELEGRRQGLTEEVRERSEVQPVGLGRWYRDQSKKDWRQSFSVSVFSFITLIYDPSLLPLIIRCCCISDHVIKLRISSDLHLTLLVCFGVQVFSRKWKLLFSMYHVANVFQPTWGPAWGTDYFNYWIWVQGCFVLFSVTEIQSALLC